MLLPRTFLFSTGRILPNFRNYSFITTKIDTNAGGLLASPRLPKFANRICTFKNFIPTRTSSSKSFGDTDLNIAELKSNRSKVRSICELMRWDKPNGTVLALMPSLWSLGMITPCTEYVPDIGTVVIFTAGAIVARGMGCTLNDILDRKYDRLVERTKLRPIACGDISVKEALFYLAIQSAVGLYILCLNNLAVIKLGLFSGLMISTYPLFKRFTYWPQVMLALTMNWGVIMGYAAIRGSLSLSDITMFLPIYMGSIFWTLYYDTIYAHQDKTDDMFIGVKSSALRLGSNTKRFLYQMSGSMAASLTLAGYMTGQLWPYHLSVISTGLFHLFQIKNLDLDNNEDCWRAFDRQKYVGYLIFAGVLASVAAKSKKHHAVKIEE